ncbi:Transmembrane domain-containing protein [Spironucleus salmonicida]|uniref:Transmembrane domain-containing protein n=1 Tax=Spironucleus salmonicida TaxID=348837 RepID=V6LXL2_9EUKA|nr:Transmembrane domain-containing protein [Spironucleus salmonicida]|eukprot:EST49372.1 Transmembrane domain-containing protein [Spironucleus salmonicida]
MLLSGILIIKDHLIFKNINRINIVADTDQQTDSMKDLFSSLLNKSMCSRIFKTIQHNQVPISQTCPNSVLIYISFIKNQQSQLIYAAKAHEFTVILDMLVDAVGVLKIKSNFDEYVIITDQDIAYGGMLDSQNNNISVFNQALIFSQFVQEASKALDFDIKSIITVGEIRLTVNGFQKNYIWSDLIGPTYSLAKHITSNLNKGIYLDNTSVTIYCQQQSKSRNDAQKFNQYYTQDQSDFAIMMSFIRKFQQVPKLFLATIIKYDDRQFEVFKIDSTLESKTLILKVLELVYSQKTQQSVFTDSQQDFDQNIKELKMLIDQIDYGRKSSSGFGQSSYSIDNSDCNSVKLAFDLQSSEESDSQYKDILPSFVKNPSTKDIIMREPILETVEEDVIDTSMLAYLAKYRKYMQSLSGRRKASLQPLKNDLEESENEDFGVQFVIQSSVSSMNCLQLEEESKNCSFYQSLKKYVYKVYQQICQKFNWLMQIIHQSQQMMNIQSQISGIVEQRSSESKFFLQAITSQYNILFLNKVPASIVFTSICIYLYKQSVDDFIIILGHYFNFKQGFYYILVVQVFTIIGDALLSFKILQQKVTEKKGKQYDDKQFLFKSSVQEDCIETIDYLTIYNYLWRILQLITHITYHTIYFVFMLSTQQSIKSSQKAISEYVMLQLMLFIHDQCNSLLSPYHQSVFDISIIFVFTSLIDIIFLILGSQFNFYLSIMPLVSKLPHLIYNTYITKQFYKYAENKTKLLERSKRNARKLQSFSLPITTSTLLSHQQELLQLQDELFQDQYIKKYNILTVYSQILGEKQRYIQKKRETLLKLINQASQDDYQQDLIQLQITQIYLDYQKLSFQDISSQRVVLHFNNCIILSLRLENIELLQEFSDQTTFIDEFYEIVNDSIQDVSTALILKIEGSIIQILLFQESQADFEQYNSLQVGVALGLGILKKCREFISEFCEDIVNPPNIYSTGGISIGEGYGMVLGDKIFRFDMVGEVQEQSLLNLQNSIQNAITMDRLLWKIYLKENDRFLIEIRTLIELQNLKSGNKTENEVNYNVWLQTKIDVFDYIYVTGLK